MSSIQPDSTSNQSSRGSRGNRSFRPNFRRLICNGKGQNNVPRERPIGLPISTISMEPNEEDESTASTSMCPITIQEPPLSFFMDSGSSPYLGWQLYFPQDKYDANSPNIQKIESIRLHFKRKSENYDFAQIREEFWFSLQLSFLLNDSEFQRSWNTFQRDLTEHPDITIACISLAMHQIVAETPDIEHIDSSDPEAEICANSCLQTISPRILGHGPVIHFRLLKVNNYDRLVTIRGTVIRVCATRVVCTWLAFSCPKCNAEQTVRQLDGMYTTPSSCKEGCRNRSNFIELFSSPYTRTESFQTLRIQETMMEGRHDMRRVPRNIEVELSEDLVDCVYPGDDITITGIVKIRPQHEFNRKDHASLYRIYIRAVSISSNKGAIFFRKSHFTAKDIEAIQMVSKIPSLFPLLVKSLCPSIYGHEIVKAGLVLGLFGASPKRGKRSEAHILVVGDPGVGKSQMLQACASVSPRGVFVCGNSSSSVGLTVAVRRDKDGSSLEAGALVIADQGVCCIDELDKMSSNHHALLEVMEQQTVSVAKAGVLCSLPARTCVLAAANPSEGHYNPAKTIPDNLKMNPALLSRFDLVFILLDRPNVYLDSLLIAHVRALQSEKSDLIELSEESFLEIANGYPKSDLDESQPLIDRLRLHPNEKVNLLPHTLFQKYIAYARKNINPTLSAEAGQELKKFYLELRACRKGTDTIPVTTRQLEALIRLTQARARVELSTIATHRHALDVLEIFRHSFTDVSGVDNEGLPMSRANNQGGMSQASQTKKFLRVLQVRSNTISKTVFEKNELKEIATQAGIVVSCFGNILESLNLQGFLLKKGQNMYKLISE